MIDVARFLAEADTLAAALNEATEAVRSGRRVEARAIVARARGNIARLRADCAAAAVVLGKGAGT